MTIEKFACVYLATLNLFTFIIFGIDKYKAIQQQWRISEKTLLTISFAGGWPAGWLAMLLFRHKIKDYRFLSFMFVLTVSWIIGIIVFLTLNP